MVIVASRGPQIAFALTVIGAGFILPGWRRKLAWLALIAVIGDGARPRREEKHRTELACRDDADGDTASRYVEHEKRKGDAGEPVARAGDHLPGEVQPEVAVAQR